MNEALQRANAIKKPRKSRKGAYEGPECDLQKACSEYAAQRGLRVVHIPDWVWLWVLGRYRFLPNPPERFCTWFTNTFKHLPDILIYCKGQSISFELKNRLGNLSGGQLKACEILGAHVIRSTEQFEKVLNEWLENIYK